VSGNPPEDVGMTSAWRSSRRRVLAVSTLVAGIAILLSGLALLLCRAFWHPPEPLTTDEREQLQKAKEKHRRLQDRLEQVTAEAERRKAAYDRKVYEQRGPDGGPKSLCECPERDETCTCY
jgi:hypothetical protein